MKNLNRGAIIIALVFSMTLLLSGPIDTNAAGPAAINLSSAGDFTILSKTGITNTGTHGSDITGDIGSSPVTAAAMNNVFCSEITGTVYGVDAAYIGSGDQTCFKGNPPMANKTLVDNAILDMGTAYVDAAGRTNPTATELGAGNIGGLTIAPGLYKWGTDVTIPANVTLSGSASDVWIFQIAGNLNIASAGSVGTGIKVMLEGGARASNIFWQVGGVSGATLGTYSTFNGNILSAKQIIIQTGAILNGKALAQTQVTLDANTVTSSNASVSPAITPPVVIPAGANPPMDATPVVNPPSSGGSMSPTATPALPKMTYSAAMKAANQKYAADLKAARTAFNKAMRKAIIAKSNDQKVQARAVYATARKAAQKAFNDARKVASNLKK